MFAPPDAPRRAAHVCAWAGAVMFVGSLGYFAFAYSVTFGETVRGGPSAAPIIWNVALFSAFALHHSIFARLPVRAVIARIVPAALERSLYVWVASVLFIAVCALWQPVPGVLWQLTGVGAWAAALVQLTGAWLTVRSAGMLDVFDLAGIRQLERTGVATGPAFKASGPYGRVRHPIYSAWLLIVFAPAVMTHTRLVFAVTSTVYLLVAIPFEERSLRAGSAGRYDEYSRKVPWKILPRIY